MSRVANSEAFAKSLAALLAEVARNSWNGTRRFLGSRWPLVVGQFPGSPFRDNDASSGPLKAHFPSRRRYARNVPRADGTPTCSALHGLVFWLKAFGRERLGCP